MELQAGLARPVVTQERSPGALARRNPEEASFYKLPVRRLHRGIGETRVWPRVVAGTVTSLEIVDTARNS